MLSLLAVGGLVSILNFGVHALMTALVVVATRSTASRTDHLHAFVRLVALLSVTMFVLMIAHLLEIAVWAAFYALAGFPIQETGTAKFSGGYFEFAFENYTALGYGDAVAGDGWRIIGPMTGAERPAADRLVGGDHFRGHAARRRLCRPDQKSSR